METDRTTVTLAAHARRGLIIRYHGIGVYTNMCILYTTLDSYTAFLEQRAANNIPDILRNSVRMRHRGWPAPKT